MALTTWPTKPFYLRTLLDKSYDAIQQNSDELYPYAVDIAKFEPNANQLWLAVDSGMGGHFIYNVGINKVLEYKPNDASGFNLQLCDRDDALPRQLFRIEDIGQGQRMINSFIDWNKKLNVARQSGGHVQMVIMYNYDNGSNHEKFVLVEELGSLIVDNLVYTDAKQTANTASASGQPLIINNSDSNVTAGGTRELSYESTTSTTLTDTTTDTVTKKVTASIGIGGTISKILSINASGEVSEEETSSTSYSTEKTQGSSTTITLSVLINVPAGRIYSYQINSNTSSINAKYSGSAKLASSVADKVFPVPISLLGKYKGVDTVGGEVVVRDITEPNPTTPDEYPVVSRTSFVI